MTRQYLRDAIQWSAYAQDNESMYDDALWALQIDRTPLPSRSGSSSDGETGTQWSVYDLRDVVEWLADEGELAQLSVCERREGDERAGMWSDSELAEWLTGWRYSYGGPGRWFWHDPVAVVYRHAVLVYRRGGLDI